MPLMLSAWHRGEAIGPKTEIKLNPGDVYVMSHNAIGKDWMSSSRVTWRHAAGSETCKYSQMKPKKAKKPKKPKNQLASAIHK
jgi:hypothetical protein